MEVIDLLENLLKFKSITPNDDGGLDFIANFMADFNAIRVDIENTKNLILIKKFGNGEHLCFAGHIDVVPAGNNWDSDPFLPIKKDGYIYARGSQDMKAGLGAFLCAAKEAKNFNGTLSMIITSDEEGDGKFGTIKALEYMKEHKILPDFALVAEPTCSKFLGDTIKIGRRGSINGKITIKGRQGHAAYYADCINPVHQLAQVFDKFAGFDLDKGDGFFDSSKIVITDIRGGMQVVNVTPADVKIMFNVRNSHLTSLENVQNYTKEIFKNFDCEFDIKQSSLPYISDKNSKIVQILQNSIKNILNKQAKLSTSGGTSDARHLSAFGVSVVEFGVCNDTIHKINERVSINEVVQLKEIFSDVIANF